jgi:hypothetical protein
MTQIGSGHSSVSRVHGPTFRRNAIARPPSALARIYIGRAIISSGSSIGSSSAAASLLATTSCLKLSGVRAVGIYPSLAACLCARQGRRRDPDAAGGSPHVTLEIAPRSPLVDLGLSGTLRSPQLPRPLAESRRGFWRHTAQQRGSVSIWPLGFRPVPIVPVGESLAIENTANKPRVK